MLIQRPHDSTGLYFDAVYTNVIANGAITKGMMAMWDVTIAGAVTASTLGTYVIAGGDATNYGVGVATKTVVAGDRLLVQCYGVYDGATTDGNVDAGEQLECGAAGVVKPSASTPSATVGVLDKVGVAISGDGATTSCKIFIRCM